MYVRVYENLKHFEDACSVLECIRDVAGRQQEVRSDETMKHWRRQFKQVQANQFL